MRLPLESMLTAIIARPKDHGALKRAVIRSLLLGFLILPITGCMSLSTHAAEFSDKPKSGWNRVAFSAKYVYPGVQADVASIAVLFDRQYMSHSTSSLMIINAPFFILDTPLSLGMDTLLLPYDLYMVTIGGKTRAGGDRVKQETSPPASSP